MRCSEHIWQHGLAHQGGFQGVIVSDVLDDPPHDFIVGAVEVSLQSLRMSPLCLLPVLVIQVLDDWIFRVITYSVLKQTHTVHPASQAQPSAAVRKDGMIKSWAEKKRHRAGAQTTGPGSVSLCLVFLMGKLALTCSEYVVL